jgi:hypothetical protein
MMRGMHEAMVTDILRAVEVKVLNRKDGQTGN